MRANDPIGASYPELFPKDFGDRLARLVELAGLSWEEFAERLGVESDRVTEWRGGEVPTGGEVWHIMRLAMSVPGGTEAMLPETLGRNGLNRSSDWAGESSTVECEFDPNRE